MPDDAAGGERQRVHTGVEEHAAAGQVIEEHPGGEEEAETGEGGQLPSTRGHQRARWRRAGVKWIFGMDNLILQV